MLLKTIVVVDYDTEETAHILDSLVGIYNVLVVAFNRLPDIPLSANRVSAIIILCTKPNDDIFECIKVLRICYADMKIVVISPTPTPSMVAQTVNAGANDYFNLAADDLDLVKCFHPYTRRREKILASKETFWTVWKRLLFFFKPKHKATMSVLTQKLPIVEPLRYALPQQWKEAEADDSTTPQYQNLIEVQFFGDFIIKINGESFIPKTNCLLLAYLLYNHNHPIHKEILMAKFWGENVNDAKNCLNAAIFNLRKSLAELTPEKTIIYNNDYYAFNTADWHIETDADRFIKHWEKSRHLLRTQGLESAIAELNSLKILYRGDFLQSFTNEWAIGKCDEFREKHLQALNLLSEYFWTSRKINDCIDSCLDILQVDDCFETTHRRLMECYVLLKMKDKAIRQYNKCLESLKKLNISPESETEELYLSLINA